MKTTPVTAYPLSWPEGWSRTPAHGRGDGAQFKTGDGYKWEGSEKRYVGRKQITFDDARRRLADELGRMKAGSVVLSTDVPLRIDGQPRADWARARMPDPGVAIYFTFKGKPMVMATDRFSNVAANMRSLGLAIEAMRQLERHGGGTMMERAFAGFTALPPPEGSKPKRPWWEVLHYSADPADREYLTVPEVEARWRALAKKLHPDSGNESASDEAMSELNIAKADAVAELTGEAA